MEALPFKYLAIWRLKDRTINEAGKVVAEGGEEADSFAFYGFSDKNVHTKLW